MAENVRGVAVYGPAVVYPKILIPYNSGIGLMPRSGRTDAPTVAAKFNGLSKRFLKVGFDETS